MRLQQYEIECEEMETGQDRATERKDQGEKEKNESEVQLQGKMLANNYRRKGRKRQSL